MPGTLFAIASQPLSEEHDCALRIKKDKIKKVEDNNMEQSQISEFIDTYSDDIIYLRDFWSVFLQNPNTNYCESLVVATNSRIFAVFMIGNIESMLQEWSNQNPELLTYFGEKDNQRISNEERLKNLKVVFQKYKVAVDDDVISDYLAIKYIRNAIVHASWQKSKQSYVKSRGLETDTRKLYLSDLGRMIIVNNQMMQYIASSGLTKRFHGSFSLPVDKKVKVCMDFHKDALLISTSSIVHSYWKNIEVTQSIFEDSIQNVSSIYSPPRRSLSELGREACLNWDYYYRLTFCEQGFDCTSMTKINDVLTYLYTEEIKVYFPGIENLSDDDELLGCLQKALPNVSPFSAEDVISAIQNGHKIYDFIFNLSPCYLFGKLAPQIDPENAAVYSKAFLQTILPAEIRIRWYEYVKGLPLSIGKIKELM